MVDNSRKKCERNGVETIVDDDETLWLNEKQIEEGSNDEKSLVTTIYIWGEMCWKYKSIL